MESPQTVQYILSEIDLGSRGGYTRENLKLSFDGLRFLLNFWWFQYAQYSIATLDTVNIYTPATAQDIMEEQAYADRLCKQSQTIIQKAKGAQQS